MRILQINSTYGVGSTGVISEKIFNQALKYGYKCCMAAPVNFKNREKDDIEYITIGNELDYKVHSAFSRLCGEEGFFSKKSTEKLIKQIRKFKPDVIQLHNIHSHYINIPMFFDFVKNEKIHTFITLHDCWLLTGKCTHFLYSGCSKWMTQCEKCPMKKREIPSYFFDRSQKDYYLKKKYIGENEYVHVIGCSQWIYEVSKKSILADRSLGYIYNGINLDTFKPVDSDLKKKYNVENSFVILGMAGKWDSSENKEITTYILDKMPNDWVLLLIGKISDKLLMNNKKVISVPFIKDKNELARIYCMADVFANITKADTLPTVNIESIACGTPVVTFNSGGAAEIIDSKTGYSVEYGDCDGFFNALKDCREKGKDYFRDNCRARAVELFDEDIQYDKYIDFYKNIVGEKF